jgi:hypothetical protein
VAPGTVLGVWNLIGISSRHSAASASPLWIQGHGHAQLFGWVLGELMGAVIALLQMSAEGGGSACADVAESLELLAREHVAPAVEEFLSVAAEDIGDFQSLLVHRWRVLSTESVDGLYGQGVERTGGRLQVSGGDVEIAGGVRMSAWAEQGLDGTQVGSRVQHVGGAGVSEQVGVNAEGDGGTAARLAAEGAEGVARHRLAGVLSGGEEPVRGPAPAIVNAEPFPQGRRQWDVAGNAALAVADVQEHAGRVDVLDLELAQFVTAQGGGVEGGQDGPVLQIVGVVEDAGDLLSGHDGDGERPFLGCGDLLVEPAAFEHPHVEEAWCGAIHLERIESSFLFVAQVEEILPDIFWAE